VNGLKANIHKSCVTDGTISLGDTDIIVPGVLQPILDSMENVRGEKDSFVWSNSP
jgi:hypothetical protein